VNTRRFASAVAALRNATADMPDEKTLAAKMRVAMGARQQW
jgi:hypothetical protein